MKRQKSDYTIQAVSHALELLEEFKSSASDELGVTELAKRLKLHKNNVFRLLATLEHHGYIEQNPVTGNYRLGIRALELGQTFIQQSGLVQSSRPVLEDLVRKTNETAYVAILRDGQMVYLDVVESTHVIRVVPRVGLRLPVHCTAVGKAMLAHMSEDEIKRIFPLASLTAYTARTIIDRGEFVEHLNRVRSGGYATDNEEYEEGVKCVAVPIFDHTRHPAGAITLSGPSSRMGDERIARELAPAVIDAARQISHRLGFEKQPAA
ncbi:MAG: IclR family transcriptional regulator [Deltaproteobacteria bacterium]|nr:IclR family transcriptional regulator [Deltaproteobacteria bacterium]